MKLEGRYGAYANACIAQCSISYANKVRKGKKDGKQREGDNSQGGNRVVRFAKVFPYSRSIAHEFFRVPLKSAAQTRELLTEPRMSAAKQAPPYVADFTP